MKHADIIEKMTLEEKTSLLSGKNFWETMDIPHLGIPHIFLSDGPSGLRKQAGAADQLGLNPSLPATCVPSASSIANSWDPELANKIGVCLGEEAVKLGAGMLLGPGMNVKRDPRCGRNFEYFSEDPYLAGKMSASIIRGVQTNGISACVKHFACNNQEERRLNSDSVLDERTLRELYLTGFEIAIKEGKPKSLMTSYNLVNGTYTNENQHLMKDILYGEWGYQGIAVTDWGGENDRVEGLKAGNQLEMPGNNGDTDRTLMKAVEEGKLDIAVVDEAVDKMIDLALDVAKPFENFVEPVSGEGKDKKTGMHVYPELMEEHHKIASAAARETMVLLKNEGDILPISGNPKVAVIGDFAKQARYQGAGSSQVNCTKVDNFLDLLKTEEVPFECIGFAAGFERYGKKKAKLAKEAIELAKGADTILYFLGLDELSESEGLDREDILIPQVQLDLLKELRALGKKIVAVLFSGSVVDMSWEGDVDAILHAGLAGQAGSNAVLEILSGKVNPSGKLSETYPMSYADCPTKDRFPGRTLTSEYREAIYVGYRYYDKKGIEVKYPFGFGLSYTKFEYSGLKVTDEGVEFEIKNVGNRPGREIAQLYIGLKDSKIFRAPKELKGFAKTKELAPGESETIKIAFDDKSFRYFNVKTNAWETEKGEYDIMVGASSRDIRLEGKLAKEGTTEETPYTPEEYPSYYKGDVVEVPDEEFSKLIGREIPPSELPFYNKRKTRVMMEYTNAFADLRYARGWVGRLIGNLLRLGIWWGKKTGNKKLRNTIIFGPYYYPMRALSRMIGMTMEQADGLIEVFNGHFFKGLKHYFGAGKRVPKVHKEHRYDPVPEGKKK
ncbi:MAG: glycoside hydrolase family 3 C-terminal domain-containing protein [Bacilli bacterium]|nr:glycoside hydrolase family 3 C-terminal domain-containing protein [Bacilli bacterium]